MSANPAQTPLGKVREYVDYLRSAKFQTDNWNMHLREREYSGYERRWVDLILQGRREKDKVDSGYYTRNDPKNLELENRLNQINAHNLEYGSKQSDAVMRNAETWKDYVYAKEYGKFLLRVLSEELKREEHEARRRMGGVRASHGGFTDEDIRFLREIEHENPAEIRRENQRDWGKVKHLYRKGSTRYHPDKSGSKEAFQEYVNRYTAFRDRHFPGMNTSFRY